MTEFQPQPANAQTANTQPTNTHQALQPQAVGQPLPPSYAVSGVQPQAQQGQYQAPATYAPPPSPYESTEGRPWVAAIGAGLVAGLIAAFAYAAISYSIGREFLMLTAAIGLVVGVTVRLVAGRGGALGGAIAALIAVPVTLAADILLVVFYVAGSIPDGMKILGDIDYPTAIRLYFSDGLGFVWFAVSILFAFLRGRAGRRQ